MLLRFLLADLSVKSTFHLHPYQTSLKSTSTPQAYSRVIKLSKKVLFLNLILLCNDIALNPGPSSLSYPRCLRTNKKGQANDSFKSDYLTQVNTMVNTFQRYNMWTSKLLKEKSRQQQRSIPTLFSLNRRKLNRDRGRLVTP